MVSVNAIILGGHLGAEPEEKRTASGKLVCNFRIATNRWDARADAEVTDWHSVSAFDRQAESCIKYLHKGSPVLVEGRLAMNQWEGADGKKHTRAEVIANRVSFLGSGRAGQEARSEAPPPAPVEVPPTFSGRRSKDFSADAVPF